MYNVQLVEFDSYGNYWVGTDGGLYIYSPDSQDFKYLRAPVDLSSNEVTAMIWDERAERMIIGYRNGAIDMISIKNNELGKIISNLDIASTDFPIKRINSFAIEGEKLYIGGEFGFTTLLPDQNIILEDTKKIADLPVNSTVNDIKILGGNIYAATEYGLAYASLSSVSLADPNVWQIVKQDADFDFNIRQLTIYDNGLSAMSGMDILRLQTDTLTLLKNTEPMGLLHFTASDDELYYLDSFNIETLKGGRIGNFDLDINNITYHDNALYIGTTRNSLVIYNLASEDTTYISPATPQGNSVKKIYIDEVNNEVYYTLGDAAPVGVQRLTADGWKIYNSRLDPQLPDVATEDVERIGDELFIATFGGGIHRYNLATGEYIKRYYSGNTEIDPIVGDFTTVTDLQLDDEGVLWAVVPGENTGGSVFAYWDPENDTWRGLDNQANNDRWFNIMEIDIFGNKWAGGYIANDDGLLYFGDGRTRETSDDTWGTLSRTRYPLLLANNHNDLKSDNEGNLWVATAAGLTVLLNPGGVVNGNSPVFVEKPEFSGTTVTALAVDAVNNVYVGTQRGISLYGPDGEEIIASLNTSNSDILTNDITDIAIAADGTIWVGTTAGLFSVESSYTLPSADYSLDIFPQPFRPRVHDGLTIKNLAPDTDIRIMTPSGDFINSFKTTSGTFIWDGRDANRRLVAPGVYVIIATSLSSEVSAVAKFAVTNN